jgi:hypothetical protein
MARDGRLWKPVMPWKPVTNFIGKYGMSWKPVINFTGEYAMEACSKFYRQVFNNQFTGEYAMEACNKFFRRVFNNQNLNFRATGIGLSGASKFTRI